MIESKNFAWVLVLTVLCALNFSCQTTDYIQTEKEAKPSVASQTRTDSPDTFYKGADLSYINELEDCGVKYTVDGAEEDVYELMSDYGANMIRLRLWHNATWTNYSNLTDVKRSINRAKDANMSVLLDFHYSDTWTDPEQNLIPAAWLPVANDLDALADSVYNYTYATLESLRQSNCLPVAVQIGNETNNNILVTDNSLLLPINTSRNVQLFNAGISAVNDFNTAYNLDIKTCLHIAHDLTSAMNWVISVKSNGILDFDWLGMSYYPQWQRYTPAELGTFTAQLLDTYDIQVLVAETGHIWTRDWDDQCHNLMSLMAPGYPETPCPQLQKDYLIEVKNAIRDNGGAGVLAWEPAWVSSTNVTLWGVGSNWENVTFFDFDYNLLTHGGIEFLSENNVEVTFTVDMSAANAPGYITGEFTADAYGNWQIIPMIQVGNSSIYTFKTYLTQGQSGAYYYLKDDDWSARETVPEDQQLIWNDRKYDITTTGLTQTISNTWVND